MQPRRDLFFKMARYRNRHQDQLEKYLKNILTLRSEYSEKRQVQHFIQSSEPSYIKIQSCTMTDCDIGIIAPATGYDRESLKCHATARESLWRTYTDGLEIRWIFRNKIKIYSADFSDKISCHLWLPRPQNQAPALPKCVQNFGRYVQEYKWCNNLASYEANVARQVESEVEAKPTGREENAWKNGSPRHEALARWRKSICRALWPSWKIEKSRQMAKVGTLSTQ